MKLNEVGQHEDECDETHENRAFKPQFHDFCWCFVVAVSSSVRHQLIVVESYLCFGSVCVGEIDIGINRFLEFCRDRAKNRLGFLGDDAVDYLAEICQIRWAVPYEVHVQYGNVRFVDNLQQFMPMSFADMVMGDASVGFDTHDGNDRLRRRNQQSAKYEEEWNGNELHFEERISKGSGSNNSWKLKLRSIHQE